MIDLENSIKQLLSVKNLSVGYGNDKPVLKDVEFTLQSGDILLIEGGNGVGKTTLVKTLFGLLPAISGKISWFELPPQNQLSSHRLLAKGVRYLGQGQRGFTGYTSDEQLRNVSYLLSNRKFARPYFNTARSKKVSLLSYGQSRLLSLKSLQFCASCYILDEPFAGLDSQAIHETIEWIEDCAISGIAFIVIDHNYTFYEKNCINTRRLELLR